MNLPRDFNLPVIKIVMFCLRRIRGAGRLSGPVRDARAVGAARVRRRVCRRRSQASGPGGRGHASAGRCPCAGALKGHPGLAE